MLTGTGRDQEIVPSAEGQNWDFGYENVGAWAIADE